MLPKYIILIFSLYLFTVCLKKSLADSRVYITQLEINNNKIEKNTIICMEEILPISNWFKQNFFKKKTFKKAKQKNMEEDTFLSNRFLKIIYNMDEYIIIHFYLCIKKREKKNINRLITWACYPSSTFHWK